MLISPVNSCACGHNSAVIALRRKRQAATEIITQPREGFQAICRRMRDLRWARAADYDIATDATRDQVVNLYPGRSRWVRSLVVIV
jgi:hypothetical protein